MVSDDETNDERRTTRLWVLIEFRLFAGSTLRHQNDDILAGRWVQIERNLVQFQGCWRRTKVGFLVSGRLYQVEYAMEAISHAGTCLGILASDGILLAAERRNTNKLLDEVFSSEKIYKLNKDMMCSVAGITSDANVLTNELRSIAQRYEIQYKESIPCEQLVSMLCDLKQAYTQYGGNLSTSHPPNFPTSQLPYFPTSLLPYFSPLFFPVEGVCIIYVYVRYNSLPIDCRQTSFRSVDLVHGMGQTLRLSIVSVRSQWKLWWMESDLHRKQ